MSVTFTFDFILFIIILYSFIIIHEKNILYYINCYCCSKYDWLFNLYRSNNLPPIHQATICPFSHAMTDNDQSRVTVATCQTVLCKIPGLNPTEGTVHLFCKPLQHTYILMHQLCTLTAVPRLIMGQYMYNENQLLGWVILEGDSNGCRW